MQKEKHKQNGDDTTHDGDKSKSRTETSLLTVVKKQVTTTAYTRKGLRDLLRTKTMMKDTLPEMIRRMNSSPHSIFFRNNKMIHRIGIVLIKLRASNSGPDLSLSRWTLFLSKTNQLIVKVGLVFNFPTTGSQIAATFSTDMNILTPWATTTRHKLARLSGAFKIQI